MLHKTNLFAVAAMLAIAAPAAGQQPPAQPQRAQTSPAGLWRFDVTATRGTTLGAMTVQAAEQGYVGKVITDQGSVAMEIRSIEIQGERMTLVVASPRGDVTFRGELTDAGQRFSGTMTYFNGQQFPMTGIRQQAPARP